MGGLVFDTHYNLRVQNSVDILSEKIHLENPIL